MFKKILLVLSLLFTFSCEDNIVEEPSSMKLWLNGEEVDVEANYEKITTYGEEVEYFNLEDEQTYTKKILVIHFQKDPGRVELTKEHYAVVFTDWEGDVSNGLPIDESGDTWTISGNGEGIFYNPYAESNMEGRIEFTDLKIETDEENTPYSDYGGH